MIYFNIIIYHSFEERLAAQRKEREAATAELGFKKQLTREERLEKKKQRLAAIGKAFGLTTTLHYIEWVSMLLDICKYETILLENHFNWDA